MKVVSTIHELHDHLRRTGLSPAGFVPTMGALHDGHLSLVRKAVSSCSVTVVSIFVNPTQFNDKNDLKNYPRTLKADLDMLGKVLRKDDVVFTPSVKEIYPVEDNRVFHFGNLENVMEALHRPGHFNGVAQVITKLFEIIKPDYAFFGQKDFQQVAVIRALVKQTGSSVKIIGCPIIREKDGLAMSSRNTLLDPEIRKKAGIIFKTISAASVMVKELDIPELTAYVIKTIEKEQGFSVEYFNIVDDAELKPVASRLEFIKGKTYFGCIAVKAGKIRLIDNIEVLL